MREHCRDRFGFVPYNHVYAEIYGTPMYLGETEVRWLQVKCRREAAAGRFDEFRDAHRIWNGPSKRGHERMDWKMSGHFGKDTFFDDGFYNTDGMLHRELAGFPDGRGEGRYRIRYEGICRRDVYTQAPDGFRDMDRVQVDLIPDGGYELVELRNISVTELPADQDDKYKYKNKDITIETGGNSNMASGL